MADVPYYPPEKPVVPVADTTVAQLVGSMGNAGLAAFVQMARMRQDSQIQREKLLQDTALTMDAHAIQRRGQDLNFEIQTDAQELRRREQNLDFAMAEDRLELQKELLPLQKDAARWTQYAASQRVGALAKKTAKNAATQADFDARFVGYNLDDPNPDPIEFYANTRKLEDEFRYSTLPGVKNTLKQLQMRLEQQTLPLSEEFNEVTERGTIRKSYRPVKVPVGQVIEKLIDPKEEDAMWKMLQRSGYTRSTPDVFKDADGKVRSEVKATKTELAPEIKAMVDRGKRVDFSRGEPRVRPSGGPEESSQVPTSNGDEEPTFAPTEAQKLIESYKRHSANPSFNREKAKAFLAEKGIDVSELE